MASPAQTRATLAVVLSAALLALVGLCYEQARYNGFHLDDMTNILWWPPVQPQELSVQTLTKAANEGFVPRRPVANVSFAIDWWRGGGDASTFQVTNIAIHGLTALGVFGILALCLSRWRGGPSRATLGFAFAGAALWAAHPIQVQAVTYIVQRMASLASLFMVFAVLAFLWGRTAERRGWMGLVISAVALVLGALTKEIAYITPLLLILAEYGVVRHGRPLIRGPVDKVVLALPIVGGVVCLLGFAFHVGVLGKALDAYAIRDFTLTERLLTQPRVLVHHLSQIVWPLPHRFALEYDFPVSTGPLSPPTTVLAVLFWTGWVVAGLGALVRPKLRLVGFFLLWVPVALVIESTIIPLEMVFEHRMYLPSVGLGGLAALGAMWVYDAVPRGQRLLVPLLLVTMVIGLTDATRTRIPVWRDTESLLTDAVEKCPTCPRAHTNLGYALWELGRQEEGLAHYERAVELDPDYREALANTAMSYSQLHRYDEALAAYERLFAKYPDDVNGHFSFGLLWIDRKRPDLAKREFLRTLELEPRHDKAAMFLRYVEGQLGQGAPPHGSPPHGAPAHP